VSLRVCRHPSATSASRLAKRFTSRFDGTVYGHAQLTTSPDGKYAFLVVNYNQNGINFLPLILVANIHAASKTVRCTCRPVLDL